MFLARNVARNPLFVPVLFRSILCFLAEPSCSESAVSGDQDWHGVRVQIPDPEGRRALAALAQTCRALSEPCLNQLWRRLKSLRPLLRCFFTTEQVNGTASGLVSYQFPELTSPLTSLEQRLPSPTQWVVITRHCRRIQELEVEDNISTLLLECAIFESNLLPNLRVLRFRQFIKFLPPLLTPRLVVLDVKPYYSDKALPSFLKIFPSLCPGLKSVRFHMHMDDRQLKETFFRSLFRLEKLESVVTDADIDEVTLQHMLTSPKFKEVHVRLGHSSDQLGDFSLSPSEIPLRNVQKFELPIWRLSSFIELLRSHDQVFREVTINIKGLPETARNIYLLFTQLSSPPRRSSLQSIHLASNHFLGAEGDLLFGVFVLTHDTFQTLAVFSNLRELKLNIENPILLDDQELHDLARNWPLLRVIELCRAEGLIAFQKCITFDGLLTLVAICPELCKVGLTLNGEKVPEGVPVLPGSQRITSMRFPGSPITDPSGVAMFLSTHFPSVTTVAEYPTSEWMSPGPYCDVWMKVDKYLEGVEDLEGSEA